jgi:hypothetical protein
MKRIYCSKKLGDYIGSIEKNLPQDNLELKPNDWNAHLFTLDRKKCLIFVHALTHYTIFIEKILKKDLQNINSIFEERIKAQLDNDNLEIGIDLGEMLSIGHEIKFYKTNNNRRVIGRINDFAGNFKYHCQYKYASLDEMDVIYENGIINTTPIELTKNNKKYWTSPSDEMRKIL